MSELLSQFPCVCILGARQVGKTTLARMAFPNSPYFDLDSPTLQDRIQLAPEEFLRQEGRPVVLDEIQSVPELLPALKVVVDEMPDRCGRFVILGSASPSLLKGASETLAGRIGFVDLDPLIHEECRGASPRLDREDLWIRGGFPRATMEKDASRRFNWLDAYCRTFIERDLPRYGIDVQGPLMRKLLSMLAHVQGATWNASKLASSAGVSFHTVNRYLEILNGGFLVRILQPFHANVAKRLVKSPKVYIRDTGLYHYLLNLTDHAGVINSPYCGTSWESFVIEEIIRTGAVQGPHHQYWFYRTQAGLESDLLVENPTEGRVAVEVKFGSRIENLYIKKLRQVMDDTDSPRGFLVHSGPDSYEIHDDVTVLSAHDPRFPEIVLSGT